MRELPPARADHFQWPWIAPALVVLWFASFAPWTTLWDRDEPRFAQAGIEMARTGAWIVPTVNGAWRVQKPPGASWLMAVGVRLLGPTESAVRCGSALAAGVAVASAMRAAASAGIAPGPVAVLLATSPLLALEASAATADALLLAGITTAVAGAGALVSGASRLASFAGWTLGLLVAAFAKGPAGALLPMAIVGAAFTLARDGERRRSSIALLTAGAMVAVIPYAVWLVAASAMTGGLAWRDGVIGEIARRTSGVVEGHGGSWVLYLPYYLLVVLVGFSPWVALLPRAVAGGWSRRHEWHYALLLSWALVPIAVFSLVPTKLPHYVLPAWPALAILCAASLPPRDGDAASGDRVGQGLLLALVAAELAGLAWILHAGTAPGLEWPLAAAAALLWAIATIVVKAGLARRWRQVAAATLALQALAAFWILPIVDRWKVVPAMARQLRAHVPPGTPVAAYRFEEPSLVFYLGGPVETLATDADLARWASGPAPRALVTTFEAFHEIATRGILPADARVVATADGIDVAKGATVRLVALARGPAR